MTKNTNSKQREDLEYTNHFVSVIEILNFEFIWDLLARRFSGGVLVYWFFAIYISSAIDTIRSASIFT